MQPEQNSQTWASQGYTGQDGSVPPGQQPGDGAWPGPAADPSGSTWAGQVPGAGQPDPAGGPGGPWPGYAAELQQQPQPAAAPAPLWQEPGIGQQQMSGLPAAGGRWPGQQQSSGLQTPALGGFGHPPAAGQPAAPAGFWQGQPAQQHPSGLQAPAGHWQAPTAEYQSLGTPAPGEPWPDHAAEAPGAPGSGRWQAQAEPQMQMQTQTQTQTPDPTGGPAQSARPSPSGLWAAQTGGAPQAGAGGAPQAGTQAPPAPQWAAPPETAPHPDGGWVPAAYPGPGDAQPWMVQFNSQPAVAPARRRNPWKAVVFGVAGLVAVLGVGAGGVNAYAKHSVCSTLKGESSQISSGSSAKDDAGPTAADLAGMRKDADTLRSYGRMLVFSGDLREAVDGLADDEDQFVDLLKSVSAGTAGDEAAAKKALTRMVTVAGSVNSHARQAQGACGLPVTGILDD